MSNNDISPTDVAKKLKETEEQISRSSLQLDARELLLKFTDVRVSGVDACPDAVISHAVQYLGTHAKVIFHIKNVSVKIMENLADAGKKICVDVLNKIPSSITVDAGKSPVFRGQWDFVAWGIPILRSSEIEKHVLKCFINKLKEV
jgi:hypothetical protein